MSELREEILGASINKKRVLGVILVAVLLISVFAFSMVFISLLFGGQRLDPSDRKVDADEEIPLLIAPPYPFDEDFWRDLFDDLTPEELQDLMDMLSEMFDGDIDELDLGNFSQELLDLLYTSAGDVEVFRVYDYLDFANMEDVLWKYESFDQYTGEGWESTAGSDIYSFFTYGEYYSKFPPYPEILKIKMPLSPNIGINSMVLPSLFPTPNIMENSVSAPNLIPDSTTLYKTDYNSSTLDLSFSSDEDVNMTYKLFGFDLPSASEINNSAIEARWTPVPIQAKYLQLPPDIDLYKSNNPFFTNHVNILNGTINDTDNAFEVAVKIRNYLQTQFSFPLSPDDYNPAPEGRDIIDWFCETQQGLWSDWASAFCGFTRVFGISSRFVDGFNNLNTTQFFDNDEGQWGFAIKYKNLYNWAEIYVPTDITGNGNWVQVDIFEDYAGTLPISQGNYSITVSLDKLTVNRPDVINITATMSSDGGDSIDNNRIIFTDLTAGQEIGSVYTDSFGMASQLYNINNSHVVGPHLIEARYDFFTRGGNITTILGNIDVNLTTVNPQVVNRSDTFPDTINIQGYLYDPINGERVEYASVNLLLFQIGTSFEEVGAFSPSSIISDNNGNFDGNFDISQSVPAGQYEVRADFNGTWIFPYPPPLYVPIINDSSNRMGLNITTALTTWFYINGYSTTNPNLPSISRYQVLNLTAQVILEGFGPMSNEVVYFYDYTRGSIQIGSDTSDLNGFASINYTVGVNSLTGPNLLYSMIGSHMNYSYYILNEEPTINAISGPTPQVINRTGMGDTEFNIVGDITDTTNPSNPLSFSEITLKLMKGSTDYSSYLVPFEGYPYQTDITGTFDLTFGVAPNTPPGNYSLRLDFNGTIDLSSYPYPNYFTLSYINTSTYYSIELKIDAETSLDFWINGIPNDDAYNPVVYRDDSLNLLTKVHHAGVPVPDGEWVYFYDGTQDNFFIGSAQTIGGFAQVFYNTNWNTTAGPHLIYATWNNKFNFSYFILDAPISVNLDICPQPTEINRSGTIGRNFWIHGYLNDSFNGNTIKFSQIEVRLYDPADVSFYLNEPRFTQLGETGEINLFYTVSPSTPAKNYTLQVRFDGIFIYANPFYPQFFNLNFLGNMTDSANGFFDLKVIDPDDIDIFFFIDGNPTLSFYWNGAPPESYNGGEMINFSVYITQGGPPVNSGTVSFTDVYTGDPLGTQPVVLGYASILANSTTWHAGLHRIKAQWSGSASFNTTYIVINKTVSIFSSIDTSSILRNVDIFSVSGTVQEGVVLLRGLRVNLILLDGTFNDVSGYLVPPPPRTLTTDNAGYYQFVSSINLNCPQGQYYINISFTGDIDAPGIWMTNFMIHNSSILIPINITAGTNIIENTWYTDYDFIYPEYSDRWIINDTLHVIGTLTWDNGSVMSGMYVNVTVKLLDGTIIAYNDTVQTDISGVFNVSIFIDGFSGWPDFRNESEIWVYFDPVVNSIQYVEGSENEFTS